MKKGLSAELYAEFMGTLFLVFLGPGSIVVNELSKSLGLLGIAFTFGFIIIGIIYTFGHISGGHFNPAVTIAFLVLGEISFRKAVSYIVAQVLGGIAASGMLLALFGNVAHLGATLPQHSVGQSFGIEFILTFVLMTVILGSAYHKGANHQFAGIAIAVTVIAAVLVAGPVSMASMNPARSIGPALVSGTTQDLWLYIVAPILGALVATFAYKLVHTNVVQVPADEDDDYEEMAV